MWSVRLLARVPSEKRREFALSARSLLAEEGRLLRWSLVLQDPSAPEIYCCIADGDSPGALAEFLASEAFGALRGAAEALGRLEDIAVLERVPRREA